MELADVRLCSRLGVGWHPLYWLQQRQMEFCLAVRRIYIFLGDFQFSERSLCSLLLLLLRALFLLSGLRSADPSCLRAEGGVSPLNKLQFIAGPHMQRQTSLRICVHTYGQLRVS